MRRGHLGLRRHRRRVQLRRGREWGHPGGLHLAARALCPDGATCPSGYWLYTDQTCNTEDPEGPTQCAEVGDQRCHKLCDSDVDCVGEPCRPHCIEVELYDFIDACAPAGFSICDADEYFYCY